MSMTIKAYIAIFPTLQIEDNICIDSLPIWILKKFDIPHHGTKTCILT